MPFLLHSPGTGVHLEQIAAAADGARAGGGVFAFASARGIERLLDCPGVDRMTRTGTFRLVVGVDATTNVAALRLLQRQAEARQGLEAHVFFHAFPGTFHPKFSWYERAGATTVVTGSGNLTVAGLGEVSAAVRPRGNWEAFSVETLTGANARGFSAVVDAWFDQARADNALRAPDDPAVLAQAIANSRARFCERVPRTPLPDSDAAATEGARLDAASFGAAEAMIREISENRNGQADLGRRGLGFFGFTGVAAPALVQHVSLQDVVGELEAPRMFVNNSRNYRIELNAIRAVNQGHGEHDERMLLVAVKLDDDAYRYCIVPVVSEHYQRIASLLPPVAGARRVMRMRLLSAEELREAWPQGPDQLFPAAPSPGGV